MDLSKYAAGTKKFMSKALYDPEQGEDLTIAKIEEELFTERDGRSRNKLVIHWVEDRPPLVMNVGQRNWILGEYGPKDEHWLGKRVHVFHDPTIEFPRGTRVGGLAFDRPGSQPPPRRSHREAAGLPPAPVKAKLTEAFDDDVPF